MIEALIFASLVGFFIYFFDIDLDRDRSDEDDPNDPNAKNKRMWRR